MNLNLVRIFSCILVPPQHICQLDIEPEYFSIELDRNDAHFEMINTVNHPEIRSQPSQERNVLEMIDGYDVAKDVNRAAFLRLFFFLAGVTLAMFAYNIWRKSRQIQ